MILSRSSGKHFWTLWLFLARMLRERWLPGGRWSDWWLGSRTQWYLRAGLALSDLGRVAGRPGQASDEANQCLGRGKGGSRIMRKIHILGLALFAVLAFGATVASSAFAAPGEWLFNGATFNATLNVETTGKLTLVRLVSETNSAVLTEIECGGIFDGTITQLGAGVKGTDTITALLNTLKELINELGEAPELELNCTVTLDSGALTDCKAGTLAQLWPDNMYNANGFWLTELLELEANGLVLDHLFGLGVLGQEPGYEVRCESLIGVFGEELCEGPTTFDLTNGVETVNSIANLTESPEVHCLFSGTNEEKVAGLSGEGLICVTSADLVCTGILAVS